MLDLREALSSGLLFLTVSFAGCVLTLTILRPTRPNTLLDFGPVAAVYLAAAGLVIRANGADVTIVIVLVCTTVVGVAGLLALRDFSPIGRFLLASHLHRGVGGAAKRNEEGEVGDHRGVAGASGPSLGAERSTVVSASNVRLAPLPLR